MNAFRIAVQSPESRVQSRGAEGRGQRANRRIQARCAGLAAVFVFAAASSIFAAEPQYSDLPLFQPLTNLVPNRPFASSNAANTVHSVPQAGTNANSAAVTNSMDALDDKHKLAIGDHLSFRIVEDEEDPRQLIVTDSGDLEVPYIGRFPGEGRSCRELARALKTELEKEFYYQATVIVAVDVMTRSRGRVYLTGPVRQPGPQEIPSDEQLTVSKAIMRAGGFGDFANSHNVKVTRKGSPPGNQDTIYIINVAEILEKGRTDSDLILESGDLITIQERSIRF